MDQKASPTELAKAFVGSHRDLIHDVGVDENKILKCVSENLVKKRTVYDTGGNTEQIIDPVLWKEKPETDPERQLLEKIKGFLRSISAEQIDLAPLK